MLQSFKMALKSIWGNKMRSFLTMLGIIIGVASVIILVGIVNGYMSYMTESFASMGVNQITVSFRALPSRTIDVDEFYGFYEENQDLFQGMTPSVSVSATVKHGSDTMDATTVGGYSEDQLAIRGYELSCGRNLLYSDMASRQKVALVGAYVASELFGSPEKTLGEKIKLNGDNYTVSGWRGCYEYHAGIGHRAYQGDWYPEGSGSQKAGDPPAVCHRGGCDQHHRRSGRNPAGLPGQRRDRYAHGN